MAESTRSYGGRSAEERRAERRHRLVDAALAIWGEQGWAAVTMRRVCARAGLIDRYFYESFPDRDALLVAVWDQLRDEAAERLMASMVAASDADPIGQLRAAIAAFVHELVGDPRRARIAFGEHAGSPALEARRRETLQRFTELLVTLARPHLRADVDETAFRMSTLMGLGGFVELIAAWQGGVIEASPEEIIQHTTEVGAALAAQYLRPVDGVPRPGD